MSRALRVIEGRLLPRGWSDLFHQVVLFAGAFVLYDIVRGIVDGGYHYKPFGDAMKIINLERTLHVFVEPSINAWAFNRHWLMDVADWVYLNGHFFVTVGAMIFIYVRRNSAFYFLRNTLMISMGLALAGYWLYPTAPPRMFPEWGFTDSVSRFLLGGTGWTDQIGPGKALVNGFAAVPSMHVCFAVMLGFAMAKLVRRPWAKVVWALYPLLVTFVVVATANHYLFDVFLGALTAAVAALLAKRLLARARPEKWAFSHATA